jgi:hypothetical protein
LNEDNDKEIEPLNQLMKRNTATKAKKKTEEKNKESSI